VERETRDFWRQANAAAFGDDETVAAIRIGRIMVHGSALSTGRSWSCANTTASNGKGHGLPFVVHAGDEDRLGDGQGPA
jgi:hypothetical protein